MFKTVKLTSEPQKMTPNPNPKFQFKVKVVLVDGTEHHGTVGADTVSEAEERLNAHFGTWNIVNQVMTVPSEALNA